MGQLYEAVPGGRRDDRLHKGQGSAAAGAVGTDGGIPLLVLDRALGWGVLLLRGFGGGPVEAAAPCSVGMVRWPVGEGPGAVALALVPVLLALGMDPWGRPRLGGSGSVLRLPAVLAAAHPLRPVPPLEQADVWGQARLGTLLALRRRAGPDLWLACWRRHPWEAQWYWRCRPQPLPAFQQRFLAGAGACGPEGHAGSR